MAERSESHEVSVNEQIGQVAAEMQRILHTDLPAFLGRMRAEDRTRFVADIVELEQRNIDNTNLPPEEILMNLEALRDEAQELLFEAAKVVPPKILGETAGIEGDTDGVDNEPPPVVDNTAQDTGSASESGPGGNTDDGSEATASTASESTMSSEYVLSTIGDPPPKKWRPLKFLRFGQSETAYNDEFTNVLEVRGAYEGSMEWHDDNQALLLDLIGNQLNLTTQEGMDRRGAIQTHVARMIRERDLNDQTVLDAIAEQYRPTDAMVDDTHNQIESQAITAADQLNRFPTYRRLVTHLTGGTETGENIPFAVVQQILEQHPTPNDFVPEHAKVLRLIREDYPDADPYPVLRDFIRIIYTNQAALFEQYKLFKRRAQAGEWADQDATVSVHRQPDPTAVQSEQPVDPTTANNGSPRSAAEIETGTESKLTWHIESVSVGTTYDNEEPNRENEDATLEMLEQGAVAVFDGVGGGAVGEWASKKACDEFDRGIQAMPQNLDERGVRAYIMGLFEDVDKAIRAEGDSFPREADEQEPASTATLALLWESSEGDPKIILAWVGDSRMHRLRNGELENLNYDLNKFYEKAFDTDQERLQFQSIAAETDSLDEMLAKAKQEMNITPDQETRIRVRYHEVDAQYLSPVLGTGSVKPKIEIFDVDPDDQYLATSDGITDNLFRSDIEKHLTDGESLQDLVQKAIDARKKRDDASVVKLVLQAP